MSLTADDLIIRDNLLSMFPTQTQTSFPRCERHSIHPATLEHQQQYTFTQINLSHPIPSVNGPSPLHNYQSSTVPMPQHFGDHPTSVPSYGFTFPTQVPPQIPSMQVQREHSDRRSYSCDHHHRARWQSPIRGSSPHERYESDDTDYESDCRHSHHHHTHHVHHVSRSHRRKQYLDPISVSSSNSSTSESYRHSEVLSRDRRPLPISSPVLHKPSGDEQSDHIRYCSAPQTHVPAEEQNTMTTTKREEIMPPVSSDEDTGEASSDPEITDTVGVFSSLMNEVTLPTDAAEQASTESPALEVEPTHTSQCDAALHTLTPEAIDSLLSTEAPRPESALRKEKWAFSLYTKFCQKINEPASFPLNLKCVSGFLRFLAVYGHYSLSGIESVIAPALRRINTANKSDNDKQLALTISTTIKELRRNPKVKQKGSGKPPLCSFDVSELVSRIPDTLPSKTLEASLFLFAHHTGARALTCENVLVGDIQQLELDETGLAAVVINLRVAKGNPNWDHPVVIEGYINQKHPLDAVFYLNQHLKSKFNLSLKEVVDRTEGEVRLVDTKPLWSLSREAMRERLKKRLQQTGFPSTFAFHSFRSGFLCSALLAAGSDPGRKTSVLETTGIVAGWQVYGKAQRRYIKTVAERTIVASRLLNLGIGLQKPTETGTSSSTVTTSPLAGFIRTPKTSEEFHGFHLKPPQFSAEIFRRALRRIFNTRFLDAEGDSVRQLEHANNCFNNVLAKWGRELLEQQGRKRGTYNEWRRAGSQKLNQLLVDLQSPPELIAQLMWQDMEALKLDPKNPPVKVEKPRESRYQVLTAARQIIRGRTGKDSRKRFRWTPKEDKVLIDAYENRIPFSHIMKDLPGRMVHDAYDRWKLIKGKVLKPEDREEDAAAKEEEGEGEEKE